MAGLGTLIILQSHQTGYFRGVLPCYPAFSTQLHSLKGDHTDRIQFHPDQDGSAEIWNSRIVTPQNGQYAFLLRLDKPVDNSQLYIQFILQAPAPPPEPPTIPSPPPPQPPAAPPGDMQDFYRQQGYRIAPEGAVEFYFVSFRTNKTTGQQELC